MRRRIVGKDTLRLFLDGPSCLKRRTVFGNTHEQTIQASHTFVFNFKVRCLEKTEVNLPIASLMHVMSAQNAQTWMMMTEDESDHARLALEGAFLDEVKYTSRNL